MSWALVRCSASNFYCRPWVHEKCSKNKMQIKVAVSNYLVIPAFASLDLRRTFLHLRHLMENSAPPFPPNYLTLQEKGACLCVFWFVLMSGRPERV